MKEKEEYQHAQKKSPEKRLLFDEELVLDKECELKDLDLSLEEEEEDDFTMIIESEMTTEELP